jgi:RimJ/RimL family protein N-acetyltransferase
VPANVRLRPVEPSDLEVLFEHQRDPEAVEMAIVPPRAHEAFMSHWRDVLADAKVAARAVLDDGVVAGHVVSWADGDRRMIGYWLGREHWGRGVATAAVRQFLAERPERPLYARVAVGNLGSRRVLEKNGFVAIGGPEVAADGVTEVVLGLEG